MTSISIRLPYEIATRLQNLSKLTGRTKTFYVHEAICRHLDDLEDIYISENRLGEMRSGKVKPLTLDDLIRTHGVDP
ncbi:MAG: TraY domain-containing protein [Gammaproteobacteria bacterium]|nr:TraY domain-containing protein [Gammaproteobacteria bacterium]